MFKKMPTLFDPVDLKFKVSENSKRLDGLFSGQRRQKPQDHHVPPVPGISQSTVNGKLHFEKTGNSIVALESIVSVST
jgi:hypothetical protein